METLKDNIEYSNKLQGIINQNNVRLTSGNYVWKSSMHIFSGKEILETHEFNWFWGKYIEDKENGPRHIQYLKNDPVTRKSICSEIVEKLNCSEENISLLDNKNIAHVEPPQERVGEVGNSFIFNQYNVDYEYAKNLKPIITVALLSKTDEQYSLQQREIIEKLLSEDDIGRAKLLSHAFTQPDSEFTINQIKAIGFDFNYLSYLSIEQDNPDLFAFSHSYGTDYANYLVKDKTLLQHLVHSNMTEQIQQGIESSPYLGVTVASAIKQSDLSTIKHLLSHDIHLLKNHYDGYTIIQMAVMQDDISIETIEALIELDSSSCSILARSGESVFKIACESGRDDIIEVLAQHIDISQEINQLSTDISANVKAEIVERNDDYTLTQLLKGEWEVRETDYEIAQLKSVYNSCRNEYSAFYKEEDVLSEIEIREARELIKQLETLTVQDRTKLLFEIFSDESQTDVCNIIKSLGIDIDLLAYMACEFNKTPILEFALDKGASLDNNVGSGETTIETILKSDNPEHIELMLSHSNGFICTIINAAEHSRLDLLSKIYQLDKTAFTNNDRIIGYTPIHFLLLGNHISAFEHVISIAPECLDAKTLKGESLLKVGLRSASDEILPLLISKYNNIGDQIKSFIASDEDALAIKLVDHIKLNIETVADNILFAVEKGRDDLARELLLFGNLNEEEIIHYIEGLKDNEYAQRFLDLGNSGHTDTGFLEDEFALIELEGQADNFLWEYSG